MKILKILMLEDLEDDVDLIERELNKANLQFISQRVDTRQDFIDALDSFHPDVILSDHAMPQFNSIEALSVCQARGLLVPFVLVTGTVSEEFAVSCLKQGVDDYILKSNLSRLPSAIANAQRQRRMQQQKSETETSLKMQNEQLIKINKELDSFVYSVSHNLRGPIASVRGLINLTRMEPLGFDSRTYFNLIERRIQNLDHTIRQILDQSRNARMPVSVVSVSFRALVDEILYQLEYLENYKKITLQVAINPALKVITDHYRLFVILQNLITNAFWYTDNNKDKPWIRIEARRNENSLLLNIEDNGMGMKGEVLDRACDMFFRGTNVGEGAGLGLYITHESVTRLGGEIHIDSSLGVGTKVTVQLPLPREIIE